MWHTFLYSAPNSVVFCNIIQSYFRKMFSRFSESLSQLLRLGIPFELPEIIICVRFCAIILVYHMVHAVTAQSKVSAPPPPSAVSPHWTGPP